MLKVINISIEYEEVYLQILNKNIIDNTVFEIY